MEKRRNCSLGAGLFSTLFYIYFLTSGVKLHIHLLNVVVQFIVFRTLSTLICRGTDISKYFSESLGIRDNESTVVRSSGVGNSVKMCCFTKTMPQLIRLPLLWLPSWLWLLNWFNIPLHSSDLAPSDFHLFPKLTKAIFGTLFSVWWWRHTCSGGLSWQSSRKHAYIILTPLNPTFI